MASARRVSAVLLAALVALIAVPTAVAASSVTGQLVRELNRQLLYLAVPIALLVEVILVYTVWRFRDNDDPLPTRENRQLEITWTVATALVLLFVGTASFQILAHPYVATTPENGDGEFQPGDAPADAVEVRVVAEQWNYTFAYPDENVTTDKTLVVPTNRTVYLYVTSTDVIHSVHVPELGLKQDAFPGQYGLLRTEITERGTYRLYCAELCGVGHARMLSSVTAVSEGDYTTWLREQRGGNDGSAPTNDSATPAAP